MASRNHRRRRGRPKLAILGPLPPPMTGMEAITLHLLRELESYPYEPLLAWRHVDTSVSASLAERERLHPRKVIRLLRQCLETSLLAARGFDAYAPISQNTIGLIRDASLLLPFRLARRRIIVHLNGGVLDHVLEQQPTWLRRWIGWTLGRGDARGIVVSPSLRRCLEPLVPRDRISVVPNTAGVADLGAEKEPPPPLRVLYLSNLIGAKGYRELIDATRALVERGVPIELEVAGVPYTACDREWLQLAELPDPIRILGYIEGDAKLRALKRAHVLVQPSIAPEGQPLTILEGMAAGCAIVATSHEGIVDTVSPMEGILLPALSSNHLRRSLEVALEELAGDPARVVALGRHARMRYDADFSAAPFIDAWLAAVL